MAKETPFKTLFVDIGGVFLTNGWDRNSRELAVKTFNLDYKEMDERHKLAFDTYEVGKFTLEEYLNITVFYEKRSFTMAQFQQFMFDQSKPFTDMIELISGIKEKYKLKIVAVSNEGRELNAYRIAKFKLGSIIDFFVSSSYVHLRKPDPEIFKIALDLAQTPVDQVLYIEDRFLFVQIAEGLGIRGLHHTDYESTKFELDALFKITPKTCVEEEGKGDDFA